MLAARVSLFCAGFDLSFFHSFVLLSRAEPCGTKKKFRDATDRLSVKHLAPLPRKLNEIFRYAERERKRVFREPGMYTQKFPRGGRRNSKQTSPLIRSQRREPSFVVIFHLKRAETAALNSKL